MLIRIQDRTQVYTMRVVICEAADRKNIFNPKMHVRFVRHGMGVRVTHCGKMVKNDCPHIPVECWGEEDMGDAFDQPRVWCPVCGRMALRAMKYVVEEVPEIPVEPKEEEVPKEFTPRFKPVYRHPRSGEWQMLLSDNRGIRNAGVYYGHSDEAWMEVQRRAEQFKELTGRTVVPLSPFPIRLDS